MQKENKMIVPGRRKKGCLSTVLVKSKTKTKVVNGVTIETVVTKKAPGSRRPTGFRRLWSTTDPVTGGKKTGKFSEVLMAHIGLQNLQSAYEKKQLHFQKTKVKA